MAKIDWLGHASFRIKNGVTIYIDPWKLTGEHEKADIILLSHDHFDHLSPEDIAKVRDKDTIVLGTPDCQEQVQLTRPLRPGESFTELSIPITTVPAYNVGKEFHPKEKSWIGFLISIGGETVYFAGDTDVIPDMENLGGVDVALLPCGGTYTMGPEEAAEAAGKIKPGRAIPYHWGDIVGTEEDARRFAELASCPVEILQPVKG